MEVKTSIDQIYQKLGNLKSFLVFGQNLIPTIQNNLDFMKDTVPLLETVNRSIFDSTSKLPKAFVPINNVTNATEFTTTEILDVIDCVSGDFTTIQSKLDSLNGKLSHIVYGMHKAIVDAGLADVVLPAEKISELINRVVLNGT